MFNLKLHNTSMHGEILSGIAMFLAMSYILVLNPELLSECGLDKEGVFIATIMATSLTTMISAFYTKMPLVMAPSMSFTMFFYVIAIKVFKGDWMMAMLATYISGAFVLLFVLCGSEEWFGKFVPNYMLHAIIAGLGLSSVRIGLSRLEIVGQDSAGKWLLQTAELNKSVCCVLCLVLLFILIRRKVRGAIWIGLLGTYILGLALDFLEYIQSYPIDIYQFFRKYIAGNTEIKEITKVAFQFASFDTVTMSSSQIFKLLGVSLVMAVFQYLSAYGTVYACLEKVKESDKRFFVSSKKRAMIVNSAGSIISGCLGAAPATTSMESIVGIAMGGKTGVSAIVVAILFCLSFLLGPFFISISKFVTSPLLIFSGIIFMRRLSQISFESIRATVTSLFIFVYIGISGQVGVGLILGVILHMIFEGFVRLIGYHREAGRR